MAIVVEDGTIVDGANSYVSESDFGTYCDDRGLTPADGDAEAALIRASQWVDNTYRNRFPGYRVNGREQTMEWPRSVAYDASCFLIADDVVPDEVIKAVCEAALRELTEAGSLAPDLERGGSIQQLQAGSVSITYGSNAAANTSFQAIDGILSGLIGSSNGFTANAVRG